MKKSSIIRHEMRLTVFQDFFPNVQHSESIFIPVLLDNPHFIVGKIGKTECTVDFFDLPLITVEKPKLKTISLFAGFLFVPKIVQ